MKIKDIEKWNAIVEANQNDFYTTVSINVSRKIMEYLDDIEGTFPNIENDLTSRSLMKKAIIETDNEDISNFQEKQIVALVAEFHEKGAEFEENYRKG